MPINKMSSSKLIGLLLVFGLAIVMLFTSCSKISEDGTAAEVDGVKIAEDDVTNYIQNIRQTDGLTDDSAWADYLKSANLTSSKYRTNVLDMLIDQEVYRQLAAWYDIKADNDDLLKSKVDQVLIREAPTPKSAYSQLLAIYGEKFNGSTGYYQLMFKRAEEQKAKNVLKQIKAGDVTFEQAIENRIDEDTDGVNFNYVAYDCLITNPAECDSVLKNMKPGDISDIVKTQDYIYIFKVVDKISCGVPLNSLEDLSDYTQDNLKLYAKEMDAQNVASEQFKKAKKDFNIVKYDMPKNLPY